MPRSNVHPQNWDNDEYDNQQTNGLLPKKQGVENNQSANKRARQAASAAGLNQDQRKELHKITGNTKMSYDEIYKEALNIKNNSSG